MANKTKGLIRKTKISGIKYIGYWASDKTVKVFDVYDSDGFNAIIGLAKHRNSNGTVLYRGQCKLYAHLIPSILHNETMYNDNLKALTESLEKLYENHDVEELFEWNEDVLGWKNYIYETLEAALQHYGAKTRSVDFVDNHWTALWFALNEYDRASGNYIRRDPGAPSPESEKYIIFEDSSLRNSDEAYGYIILYLAETNVSEVNGLYLGEETYTIDLRKALPPTFLRPVSQHGWIVSKKGKKYSKRKGDADSEESTENSIQYIFDSNVVGILRINTKLIKDMLGDGSLLSQNNFFPSPKVDEGYKELLAMEGTILPINMLEQYHGFDSKSKTLQAHTKTDSDEMTKPDSTEEKEEKIVTEEKQISDISSEDFDQIFN